jgi:hypothetical protein
MHITSWVLGIILFFVVYTMYRNGNSKAKMVHMITRLVYILIVISGLVVYMGFDLQGAYAMWYGMKMLLGLIVVGAMEMVLVRTKKKKNTTVPWGLFIIALILVLYLGFKLPELPFS